MSAAILVINAGSSSVKFALFDSHANVPLARGQIAGLPSSARYTAHDANGRVLGEHAWQAGEPLTHAGAVRFLLDWIRNGPRGGIGLLAAGHRVVHGGMEFAAPLLIDADVVERLRRLELLAPLHQPHNLAAIDAVRRLQPDLPQVACFDTAFHATQPEIARRLPLPRRFADAGLRRYGFHGLSYEYIADALPGVDERAAAGRTVVAHLGNGSSMCALRGGRSVATTMGFTALDGLMMGTRSGALDPGVLLHLMDRHGLGPRDLETLLYRESGLLGVSGVSGEMHVLLESRDPHAAEAVELYVHRATCELGSLAAVLGGLDALVFTGGIGERGTEIRARLCRNAAWLGVVLDEQANAAGGPRISKRDSRTSAWVLHTNEELMIARHTRRLLRGG